jgi:hypothetical protein
LYQEFGTMTEAQEHAAVLTVYILTQYLVIVFVPVAAMQISSDCVLMMTTGPLILATVRIRFMLNVWKMLPETMVTGRIVICACVMSMNLTGAVVTAELMTCCTAVSFRRRDAKQISDKHG